MTFRAFIAFLLSATFLTDQVNAEESGNWQQEPWRIETITILNSTFPNSFASITWSAPSSLWLAKPANGVDQSVLARELCGFLQISGKPTGKMVVISVYDSDAMLREKLVKLGSSVCL